MKRCVAVTILSLTMLLFGVSAAPIHASFISKFAKMYGCVVTWGQVCDLSETVTGRGPTPPPIHVTCTPPSIYGAPEFVAWPKGAAKYHFQSTCSSPERLGAIVNVRWEGSWTPSETKTDRPNASESLEITGYEPFIPDRAPGGRVFMYWTARCTGDHWLTSGRCTLFGAYVPEDLREVFPGIQGQGFMKSGSMMTLANKRMFLPLYQQANPPDRIKTDLVNTTERVGNPLSTAGMLTDKSTFSSRGVEPGEQASADSTRDETPGLKDGQSATLADADSEIGPPTVTIKFDHPVHFLSMKGEALVVEAGIYEIESVQDLLLSLAKQGQEAILLPAQQSSYGETIPQPLALLLSGGMNEAQHLVYLSPDGKRYEAVGTTMAVSSRDVTAVVAIPNQRVKDAIAAASSVGPLPPCKNNTLPVGPRWIPVPCAMPAGMPGGLPSPPVPYVDGNNMLHACLNNKTGAFRLVRSLDNCGYDESKVKWQLTP